MPTPADASTDLITLPEASALARVAVSTLRRRVREGDLTPYRLAGRGRLLLSRAELLARLRPAAAANGHGGTS